MIDEAAYWMEQYIVEMYFKNSIFPRYSEK